MIDHVTGASPARVPQHASYGSRNVYPASPGDRGVNDPITLEQIDFDLQQRKAPMALLWPPGIPAHHAQINIYSEKECRNRWDKDTRRKDDTKAF
jgi:hypothetical protein